MTVVVGTSGDDRLFGTGGNDVIVGYDGNDQLDDGGGGADEMIGGNGDDQYYLTNRSSSIVEFANGGLDWIYTTTLAYVLPAFVENLAYTGAASFVGIGNELGNFIRGGTARDTLSGGLGNDIINGGTGVANELIGGDGDDNYFSLAAGDTIIELPDGGFDGVVTDLATLTLAANVEALNFNFAGRVAGYGNDGYNNISAGIGFGTLAGYGGNDILQGGTGGASELLGGLGDDVYYVNDVGDSVIELAGEGSDTVQIYAISTTLRSYTLAANVENLEFIGPVGSARDYTGIGNALNNRLTGSRGADFLSGLDGDDIINGGDGADTLLGDAGADQFRYYPDLDTSFDRILDFQSGVDRIALSSVFARTPTIDFVSGPGAVPTTANSTIVHDTITGMIYYDVDGTGSIDAPILLAQVNIGQTLVAGDFIFY